MRGLVILATGHTSISKEVILLKLQGRAPGRWGFGGETAVGALPDGAAADIMTLDAKVRRGNASTDRGNPEEFLTLSHKH